MNTLASKDYNKSIVDMMGSAFNNGTGGHAGNFSMEDTTNQKVVEMSVNLRIVLYAIICVLSLCGNMMVIVTLLRNRHMRTVTNVFLVNLAVGDLLLGVFCMPFTLVGSILRNFLFGKVMCVLLSYLQGKLNIYVQRRTFLDA